MATKKHKDIEGTTEGPVSSDARLPAYKLLNRLMFYILQVMGLTETDWNEVVQLYYAVRLEYIASLIAAVEVSILYNPP